MLISLTRNRADRRPGQRGDQCNYGRGMSAGGRSYDWTRMKQGFCVLLALVAYSATALAQADQLALATLIDGRLTVRSGGEINSLDHAVAQLRKVCNCAIALEDPKWEYAGDLRTDTLPDGRSVSSLKTGPITASRAVSGRVTREDVVGILEDLVEMQQRNGNSARYQVLTARAVEVRPVAVKNAEGAEVAPSLLLDTPIMLSRDTANIDVWLNRIVAELRRVTGTRIIIAPHQGAGQLNSVQVALDANQQPARQVVDRLLQAMPRDGAWTVNYMPFIASYSIGLSFRSVEAR